MGNRFVVRGDKVIDTTVDREWKIPDLVLGQFETKKEAATEYARRLNTVRYNTGKS